MCEAPEVHFPRSELEACDEPETCEQDQRGNDTAGRA
jgi:hypothetical protein